MTSCGVERADRGLALPEEGDTARLDNAADIRRAVR